MAKRSGGKAGSLRAFDGISNVRAIDRAIAILNAFSADRPAMSVIELQRRVGLSRPTLYRLLHTLALKGFIRVEGDPQRFKLGHGVMQLAHVWLKGLDVVGDQSSKLFTKRQGKRLLFSFSKKNEESVSLNSLATIPSLCPAGLGTP